MINSRFPYLPFTVQVRQMSYDGEALIDTGFDGGFAVPPPILQNVGPPDGYELWQPVAGPPVLAPAYRAVFQIGDL